ncbi:MAG: peptidase S8, partial [Natronosporangium sp.]
MPHHPHPRRLLAVLLPVVLAAVLLPAPAGAEPVPDPGLDGAAGAGVEPALTEAVAGGELADFWVYLDRQADLTAATAIPDRAAQGQAVFDALTTTAADSQAGLRELLDAAGVDYQPFWIANAVKVRGDRQLLRRIAELPEVTQVTADRAY